MIRQATHIDIPALESMYKSRVLYNDIHGMHQWSLEDVTWETLSKHYIIENFYILEEEGELCGAMCLVDYDPTYWEEIATGTSLFMHKLCVSPKHSKKGHADTLISFFKQQAQTLGYQDARLDVREYKSKLRQMYERNHFQLYEIRNLFTAYQTALYIYRW